MKRNNQSLCLLPAFEKVMHHMVAETIGIKFEISLIIQGKDIIHNQDIEPVLPLTAELNKVGYDNIRTYCLVNELDVEMLKPDCMLLQLFDNRMVIITCLQMFGSNEDR